MRLHLSSGKEDTGDSMSGQQVDLAGLLRITQTILSCRI